MDSFWFPTIGKVQVQGFLIRPPNFDPHKKYPVKFLIHGGPQGAWGDAWSYRWNPELFAANGYVVVMINPGGSTGYGQAFVDRVNGDWGGRPFTDLMRGLDYAERTIPSSTRPASAPSAPATAATWPTGSSATPTASSASSPTTACSTPSPPGAPRKSSGSTMGIQGHSLDYTQTDCELYPRVVADARRDPVQNADAGRPQPARLPPRRSEGYQLFDTLQRMKVPSKMLYFPDEGHWILKPQNSQLWYKTVNDWVDQWTRNRQ